MDDEKLSYFERRITREIEEIESKIKLLTGEKTALHRQLAKASAERTGIQAVTRKNSLNRVLAENSILVFLNENRGRASTAILYRNAQLTNFDLKENTFRTYLHRMKKRDLIKTAGAVGYWALSNPDHFSN